MTSFYRSSLLKLAYFSVCFEMEAMPHFTKYRFSLFFLPFLDRKAALLKEEKRSPLRGRSESLPLAEGSPTSARKGRSKAALRRSEAAPLPRFRAEGKEKDVVPGSRCSSARKRRCSSARKRRRRKLLSGNGKSKSIHSSEEEGSPP